MTAVQNSQLVEANRQAFNDLSATYTKHPWQRKITSQIQDAILTRLDWINVPGLKEPKDRQPSTNVTTSTSEPSGQLRLLDYACGPGTITSVLAPYVTQSVGVDISEKMVEAYNAAAAESKLDAHAVVGDFLADGDSSHPELKDFDLAVVSGALHHMEDPELGVKSLAERVRRGSGVVVVVDFMPFEHAHSHSHQHGSEHGQSHGHGNGGSHSHAHSHSHSDDHGDAEGTSGPDFAKMAPTIKKHGFTREETAKLYADAGMEQFAWEELEDNFVMGPDAGTSMKVRGFIARGTRV